MQAPVFCAKEFTGMPNPVIKSQEAFHLVCAIEVAHHGTYCKPYTTTFSKDFLGDLLAFFRSD
jgi:hypothetical protein